MKHALTLLLSAGLFTVDVAAQTNTFPADGNVGIGTTSPSAKLHVVGSYKQTSNSYTGRYSVSLTGNNTVAFNHSTLGDFFVIGPGNTVDFAGQQIRSAQLGAYFSNTGTGYALQTVSGNNVLNSSSGNTLIGTTTDAGYKLDVNGTARISGATTISGAAAFGGATYFLTPLNYVGNGFSDITTPNAMVNFPGDGSIGISTGASSSTRRFTVLPNGNIGIGTTAPAANLQIAAATVANRDQGPFQFSITDGTINRFYAVHDVNATRLSLVSPSGAVQNMIEGSESGFKIGTSRSITLETSAGYALDFNGSYELFRINGAEMGRMTTAGLGLGTITPSAQFHTTGTVRFEGLSNDNTQSRIVVSDANGNLSYRDAATVTGTSGWAFNGSTVGVLKSIGTTDNFDLPLVTNGAEQMRITTAGDVGIGTSTPQGKLAVNGTIYGKKVKVTQTGWPDYVFDKGYHLPGLEEVERFIQQNKHLPDMPSATEVEKQGLDLGDNQATLLKKIEELTLYVIEQNKKIEMQQKRIETLEKTHKK